MHNTASRTIFDYWINLRRDRTAPLRTEIDPAALRHLLPHLFILAPNENDQLAFRLAGTRICELFGRELRNTIFPDLWLGSAASKPAEIARSVIDCELPALLDIQAVATDARNAYEMVLLPMRSTEEQPSDRLLGSFVPQGSPSPASHLPLLGLALKSWTFLSGNTANFGVPLTGDRISRPELRQQA